MTSVSRLAEKIQEAAHNYYRLILVLSPFAADRTKFLQAAGEQLGYPLLNLNLILSEQLLGLTEQKRKAEVLTRLPALMYEAGGETVLIDSIEILFLPDLGLDPLKALQSASRNQTMVVSWPGTFDGQDLIYAERGHPEYRIYHNIRSADSLLLIL